MSRVSTTIQALALITSSLSLLVMAVGGTALAWMMIGGGGELQRQGIPRVLSPGAPATDDGSPDDSKNQAAKVLSQRFNQLPGPAIDEGTAEGHEELLRQIRELERQNIQHGLTLATVIVAGASLLALVVFPTSAWLSFAEARRFKREIQSLKGQLHRERQAYLRKADEIEEANRQVEQKIRSIEHVRDRYTEVVLQVVQALEKSKVFGKKGTPEIRQQLYEAQARMDLRYPDKKEVEGAIWKLHQQGSASSIPDLDEIARDSEVDPELRLAAQRAILAIEARMEGG